MEKKKQTKTSKQKNKQTKTKKKGRKRGVLVNDRRGKVYA